MNGKRKGRSPHCPSGKRCRLTLEEAIAAAIRLSHARGYGLRTYVCPLCHTWHLTKRPMMIGKEEA